VVEWLTGHLKSEKAKPWRDWGFGAKAEEAMAGGCAGAGGVSVVSDTA
jgi:hypothetical protein